MEDIIVVIEIVEGCTLVSGHLLEAVLLVLAPELLLLAQRHRLRVYHHV